MAQSRNGNRTPKKPRGPGRRFQPGQSGNPGGRPKGKGLVSLIRERTKDGRVLVDIMMAIATGKRKARSSEVIRAVQWLADRGYGKVAESIEVTGDLTLEQIISESWRVVKGGKSAEGDGESSDVG